MNNRITGGEDTAHISLWLEWDFRITENVMAWQHGQKIQKNGPRNGFDEIGPIFYAGDTPFEVQGYGHNPGKSRYTYFPYVLIGNGVRYCFTDRAIENERSTPNCRIEIGSLPLMTWGFEECWRQVQESITAMGATILRNHLSRIDACVDLPDISVDGFQMAVWEGRFVSRARTKDFHDVILPEDNAAIERSFHMLGARRTGITIGRSSILCRIYDKLIESALREDKLAILRARRWGNRIPEHATRVEFQIRNEALDALHVPGICTQIATVEDWIKARASVCRYLCTSWLRLYRRGFDRAHTERLSDDDLLPAWKETIAAFEAWTGPEAPEIKRNTKTLRIDAFALIREGLGCLRSAFVRCGVHFDKADPNWQSNFLHLTCSAFKRVWQIDGLPRFFQRQRMAEDKLDASLPWSPLAAII